MENIIKTGLLGLFFGTFGTTIGGIIGAYIKGNSKKYISFILELASGLMISIVCFDLVPEALNTSNMIYTLTGIILGVIIMFLFEEIIENRLNNKKKNNEVNTWKDNKAKNKKINMANDKVKKNNNIIKNKSNNVLNNNYLLKTGIVVGIGLALHNFPEGLAIGSGFGASIKLGYELAIAILLHDIPEGLSMAVPLKNGGMNKTKVVFLTMFSGFTTGIGALFGALISNISEVFIGLSLSFAAGAMLYIVSGELLPESKKMYSGRFSIVGNLLGFILGMIALNL